MSLARAFTTRRGKQPSVDMGFTPQRSNTVSRGVGSIRHKISAPIGLTHTTNMLAYNAPDLYPKSASSIASSRSDDESDAATNASSPPTSPDVGTTPDRAESPEPNHLSCYFTAPGQKPFPSSTPAPVIPKRAPSHTKKASMDNLAANVNTRLSNQSNNSVSTKASSILSRSASVSTTATVASALSPAMKSPAPSIPTTPSYAAPPSARSSAGALKRRTADRSEATHPFGQELAQVTEIAEEFGIRDKIQITDEEEQELKAKGLFKFQADDYINEVQSIFTTFFQPETKAAPEPIWI
ncbi:uncharacterized protein B0I36DRAFT_85470 [Microdochium trichocladiopsis]|uniref:Uncharacterized protein n=1 Tax=Microdochium trichocladiopsis TaxID=1682393 RepID=A0A9P9BQH9_9PEZI|nr:uncharacterized protein B0I36DRAFT_85470 [Microdochium trichocladiopsis]KAH7034903.1 hypothetical protein B0I36DRAFT_85470 [Microdochium trichocladiopsis]